MNSSGSGTVAPDGKVAKKNGKDKTSPEKSQVADEDKPTKTVSGLSSGSEDQPTKSTSKFSLASNLSLGRIRRRAKDPWEQAQEAHVSSATHAMYIMHLPTTVRKGRCVKKFNCASEFILEVTLRLDAVPMRRSNIIHLAIAGLPNSHLPSISVLPGRVKVAILSATNVQIPGKAGLYAVAQVVRRPDTLFKTNRVFGDSNPTWNETRELSYIREDESLEFCVYSKGSEGDELLGKALLPALSIYPHGFDGSLDLKPPVKVDEGKGKDGKAPEKASKAIIHVLVKTDKACRIVAKVEQDGTKGELEAAEGISLQQDVKVEFRLFMIPPLTKKEKEKQDAVAAQASGAGKGTVPEPETVGKQAEQAEGTQTMGAMKSLRASVEHVGTEIAHEFGEIWEHMFPETRTHTKELHEDLKKSMTYMMVLKVKGSSKQMPISNLYIPQPARIFAYMGGPAEPAAKAVVSSGLYRWTSHDMGRPDAIQKNMVSFDMPKKEMLLLNQVHEEIAMNKKWRIFDMVFGFVLLFNGVVIGLAIELENKSPGKVPQSTWNTIDNVLLGIFTLELVLRLCIMGREWIKQIDMWLCFDIFVVVQGYFFLIFENFITLPFPMSVLRLLRLFKLAKMVRLVRAFRALGVLVEALGKSFSTLFWTLVLLAMMVFVGGVLIVNLVEWQYENPTQQERDRLCGILAMRDSDSNRTGTSPCLTPERELLEPWFAVSTATWELLVMTTFDNWADTVRTFAFDIGGLKACLTACCFLIILFFTAIGICNMVVGVMCNTAFLIIQKDTRMKSAGQLRDKQLALNSFRELLKTHNDRPLFRSDRFIGSDELLHACSDQVTEGKKDDKSEMPPDVVEMRACLKTLELGSSDLLGLISIFDENGQIEIDGMVEAIAIVQLQRYFGSLMTANDMIFGKSGLGVRPIDMLFFAFSTREMEASIRSTERSVMGLCSLTMDILHCLDDRTRQANSVARLNMSALDVSQARLTAKQVHRWEVAGRKPIGIKPLCKYVTQYRTTSLIAGLTLHIDIVFGFFIVLNGALVGLQTADTEDESENLFYVFDVIFTILFSVEIAIRLILHASIQDLESTPTMETQILIDEKTGMEKKVAPEDHDMMRIQELRDGMLFRMVPPWPERGRRQILVSIPSFLNNAFQLFDFVIVVICIIDTLVFAQLRRANILKMDPSVFSAVRIFRLVRLAKLLRIFKVFPQLQRLLYVIMSTARLVLFTMLIMLIVLYMFAILMIVSYGDEARVPSDSKHFHYFGGLLNAMLSGWQLLTFDDWDTLLDSARKDYPLTCAFVFLPTMVGGLMLMNMAVGVMCASAVSLVTRAARETQYESLLVFISSMGDLANLLQNELNTQTLLQEMIEAVLEIALRPKKTMHDSRHEGALRKETSPAMIKAGTQKEFVAKLQAIFRHAKLQPVMIKHVFEKVDYERQGFVHVNTFIIGALILKEDLAKLDVFASSTALRHMRSKCLEVCHKLVVCHNKMEVLLQEMCCLIYRDDYDEKMSKKPLNKNASKDFFRLSPEARTALARLADWRGEGPLPTLKSMGRMNTLHGTGKLRNFGMDGFDESTTILEGRSTQLRKEVEFGDIIIIEQTSGQGGEKGKEGEHHGGERKVIPLPVTAVMSDTQVKVRVNMVEVDKTSFEHFYIVRNTMDEKSSKKNEAATLVQVPKAHFEPTVSQAVFEWDLTTKMKLRSKLEELEEQAMADATESADQSFSHGTKERIVELQQQENQTLLKHYASLQQKIVYLIDRSLVFRHFQAWSSRLDKQKVRSPVTGGSSSSAAAASPRNPLGDKVGDNALKSLASNATNATMMSVGTEGSGAAAVPAASAASTGLNGTTPADASSFDWNNAAASSSTDPGHNAAVSSSTEPALTVGDIDRLNPASDLAGAAASELRIISGFQDETGERAQVQV